MEHVVCGDSVVTVRVADSSDLIWAASIALIIDQASEQFKIAKRTTDVISEKIRGGHSVLALDSKEVVGFAFLSRWKDGMVSHSGLVVIPALKGFGLGAALKTELMELTQSLFPGSTIISLTSNVAVVRMNNRLGYQSVPALALTSDPEFWSGCHGCAWYAEAQKSDQGQETPVGKRCCCTHAMKYSQ